MSSVMISRMIIALAACVLLWGSVSVAQTQGDAGRGEAIFKRKCKGCHRLDDSTKVGPGLQGVTERRSAEWMNTWLESPKAMIKAGDPIAVELLKKYKKTMRTLKAMKEEQNRMDVIAFLKLQDSLRAE